MSPRNASCPCSPSTRSLVVLMGSCNDVLQSGPQFQWLVKLAGDLRHANEYSLVLQLDAADCTDHWLLKPSAADALGIDAVIPVASLTRDGRDVTANWGKVQGANKRQHNSASYVPLLHRARELRCCMSQGPLPGLVRSQVRFVWKLHPDVAYTCNWADLFRKYDRDQPHTDMLPEARQHESDWTSVHTRDSGQRGIIGNLHEAFPDGDMWGGFQFFTRFSLRLALAVEFHASNVDSMDERLVPTLCGEMRWCTAAPFEPADIQTMFHCCPWAYTDPGGIASSCEALRAFQQNVRAALVDGASTPLGCQILHPIKLYHDATPLGPRFTDRWVDKQNTDPCLREARERACGQRGGLRPVSACVDYSNDKASCIESYLVRVDGTRSLCTFNDASGRCVPTDKISCP